MKRLNITPNQRYRLAANGTWKPSVHVFDQRSINAINAAWLAERPLLVRGDPGTGKSQLARAAAEALSWQLVSEVVNAQTDIQDLWYRFDAISRLGQAQLLSALAGADLVTKDSLKTELDPKKFLSPAALWWAYDWQTAQTYYNKSEVKLYHPNADSKLVEKSVDQPDYDPKTDHPKGVVLLIDEIDKADADLPNSLLETLDNARFRIPWVNESIGFNRDDDNAVRPLVIITTNEDRQLPAAFVRRCLVLNLELPDDKSELIRYLTQRGKEHYQDDDGNGVLDERVLQLAAEQLYDDRQSAVALGFKPPGQAEYLDILRVLVSLDLSADEQLTTLGEIQDFALKKYPGMKQGEVNEASGNDA